MPLHIYESDKPMPFLPMMGLFDYLLPAQEGISPVATMYDPSLPSHIDGITGRTLTRGQLREQSLRLAAGLKSLGVKRGDCGAMWGLNSIEWAIAGFATMAAGVINSPANVAYEPHELAHQLNDSGASFIFVMPELIPAFEKARSHLKNAFPASHVILLCQADKKPQGSKYKTMYELYRAPLAEPEHFDGEDSFATAWLCYSSGTTGLPKGVMTTHYNFTSQLQVSLSPHIGRTPMDPTKGDSVLGFLPMSHQYGLFALVLQCVATGCPAILIPRFDEHAVLAAIQKFKISNATFVPPIVLLLVHSQNVQKYDISSLHNVVCGAAPLGEELATAFAKRFPHICVVQGYGMTETSPGILGASEQDTRDGHLGVGRLNPGYQARLVMEDGRDAKPGERGELWVRGPYVMKGYHNNPEATAKTMETGGWLRTGDVLTCSEDGLWHVVDRVKELIKFKGYQVAPAELEALLLSHPKVIDAGVVGVHDDSQATELPRGYIVASPTAGVKTPEDQVKLAKEVSAWVAARVAKHKRLIGGMVVIEAIPKSPSGKILRNQLRARANEEFKSEARASL